MKKILFIIGIFTLFAIDNASAQSSVMRGEVSPGVYGNVKIDVNGNLFANNIANSGTFTNRSGTITLGGTAQTLAPVNASRRYIFIQNTSAGDLWINFTTTAVLSQPSILLIAGASYTLNILNITTESVSIIGATTAQAFTAKEM